MIVDTEDERIKELINKATQRLDSNVINFLNKHVVRIEIIYDAYLFTHMINGEVIPLNPEKTLFMIRFNKHRLKTHSDETVIGVIAHEFGHVWDIVNGKLLFFRGLLKKLGFVSFEKRLSEKFASEIAISWGFKDEIKKMYEETIVYHLTIPPEDIQPEEIKEDYVKLIIECTNCKQQYVGKYFHTPISFSFPTFMNVFNKDVAIAQIESKVPITHSSILKYFKCLNCNENSWNVIEESYKPPFIFKKVS